MTRLAHLVLRRRRAIVLVWIALTLLGAYSANAVSKRWLEQFSIPGYSAYEANQRTLKTFGTGENAPLVAVFHSNGDVRKVAAIRHAIAAAAARNPGSRVSSYFSTGNGAYVSRDGHTTLAELYPPGNQGFNGTVKIKEARKALKEATPQGVQSDLTGRDPLQEEASGGDTNGPSVLLEATIGGAIDYSLLMIFRFREELALGEDNETAIVETMKHAGRSVIVSGSTIAIGLLSMVILPIPVIRSIGIGGMLIPAVSVMASITLLPALLAMLGHRINRMRVMPKRIVERQDPTRGFWHRWAEIVTRRPIPVAALGLLIVALLLVPGLQINPAEAQLKDYPGKGDSTNGRQALASAHLSPGVMKPYVVLVEGGDVSRVTTSVADRLRGVPNIAGAVAPPQWRDDDKSLAEVFPAVDSASARSSSTISHLQHDILPAIEERLGGDTSLTLGGVSPEDRDFVHAVYGKFPYVLAFVILLTFVLLMRAFRSILLPLKAVVLNLVSLG